MQNFKLVLVSTLVKILSTEIAIIEGELHPTYALIILIGCFQLLKGYGQTNNSISLQWRHPTVSLYSMNNQSFNS